MKVKKKESFEKKTRGKTHVESLFCGYDPTGDDYNSLEIL